MKRRIEVILLCLLLLCSALASCGQKTTSADSDTLTGQVIVISGNTITLALGTMGSANGQPGQDGQDDGGNTPAMPSGELPNGDQPSMPGFEFAASGEEKTISLSSDTVIKLNNNGTETDATAADITVGSIVSIMLSDNTVTQLTMLAFDMNLNGGTQGESGNSTGSIALTGAYTADGATQTSTGETLSSFAADENAVLVTNSGYLTLQDATLEKTGDTSNTDESNFYGLNAILSVTADSTAIINGSSLSSSAEGANGVFATGENAAVTASNLTVHTTGSSSRGLDATYGGTINATNVDITTEGDHCAPVATDRGEGTVTITGGTLSSSGDGSPCIYSTGNITAVGVSGKATGSQIAVIEGKNSITLNSCMFRGAGLNGIMLHQSTSGDAAVGTAQLDVTSSTLETSSDGPMFYVTNTDAQASLKIRR